MRYLRPFAGQILIKPVKETNSNGIVFPETACNDLQSQCDVVAVGKGKIKRLKNGSLLRLNPEVGVGARIVVNTYAGKPVTVDGVPHRLIAFDCVQAIIESQG